MGAGRPRMPGQHFIGADDRRPDDRRPLFDEKTATSDLMRYNDSKRTEWLKTTTNYLISKVFEMRELLPWAESFQSQTILDEHIAALSQSHLCLDSSPEKISRDLWGYLNLCLHRSTVCMVRYTRLLALSG